MMCNTSSLAFIKQRNPVRERRSFLAESTTFWMEACSGINVPLLSSMDVDANPGVDYNSVRMGSLHASPPPRRAPFRPRTKRPRATAVQPTVAEETPQNDSDAHEQQERQDDQRGHQTGHADGAQETPHDALVHTEMARLRRDLMANQEAFHRRLLDYVTTEVDNLRREMRRAPVEAPVLDGADAELQRVKDEIWRHGEREILSFMTTIEHVRKHS